MAAAHGNECHLTFECVTDIDIVSLTYDADAGFSRNHKVHLGCVGM